MYRGYGEFHRFIVSGRWKTKKISKTGGFYGLGEGLCDGYANNVNLEYNLSVIISFIDGRWRVRVARSRDR